MPPRNNKGAKKWSCKASGCSTNNPWTAQHCSACGMAWWDSSTSAVAQQAPTLTAEAIYATLGRWSQGPPASLVATSASVASSVRSEPIQTGSRASQAGSPAQIAPPPPSVVPPTAVSPEVRVAQDAIKKELDNNNAAIQALSVGNPLRAALEAQNIEMKAQLARSKPLDQRLVDTRAAVGRASKRAQTAYEEATEAAAKYESALEELARFQAELAAIEAEANQRLQAPVIAVATVHEERVNLQAETLREFAANLRAGSAFQPTNLAAALEAMADSTTSTVFRDAAASSTAANRAAPPRTTAVANTAEAPARMDTDQEPTPVPVAAAPVVDLTPTPVPVQPTPALGMPGSIPVLLPPPRLPSEDSISNG